VKRGRVWGPARGWDTHPRTRAPNLCLPSRQRKRSERKKRKDGRLEDGSVGTEPETSGPAEVVEGGRETLEKKKKKKRRGREVVRRLLWRDYQGRVGLGKTRASNAFNIYIYIFIDIYLYIYTNAPSSHRSLTICTNKTDGGQRCRRITSGHLSLRGNSLLNKWQGFLTRGHRVGGGKGVVGRGGVSVSRSSGCAMAPVKVMR